MVFDPATLTFNDAGLIPVIAQAEGTGEVLMMAWMNAEAVARTLETKRVTYWSRSRSAFWVKG
jgi:phosphoribosyl-AMP cyclohydrolase